MSCCADNPVVVAADAGALLNEMATTERERERESMKIISGRKKDSENKQVWYN